MPETAGMDEYALSAHGLCKRYGARVALDSLSLELRRGEVFGLLGANGAGKTTALCVLGGLLKPDAGNGRCLGMPLGQTSTGVGYVPQRGALYDDLTIIENLHFFARARGLQQPRAQVATALAEHALEARAEQRVGTLSGGWRQRVALAAALLHSPRLLLLDEPTTGLDPSARETLWRKLHALARQQVAILITTHYADEAERCDRIGYLNAGRLQVQGAPDAIAGNLGITVWRVTGDTAAQAPAPSDPGLRCSREAQGWRVMAAASAAVPEELATWCQRLGIEAQAAAPRLADALAWLADDSARPA